MRFITTMATIYLALLALAFLLFVLAYGALYAARAVVPAHSSWHLTLSRWIEHVPMAVNTALSASISVLFYGTIVVFAALALYHA